MKKPYYIIDSDVMERLLEALSNNWFSDNGERNNDDIIEMQEELEKIIEEQDK